MALQSFGGTVSYPGWLAEFIVSGIGLVPDPTLDAAGEWSAFIGYAEQDMVVSHVGIFTRTITGSCTLELRIETVDPATGMPTGTLFGTNTTGTTVSLASTTWYLTALTASATIARGQAFAVVAKYVTGTSVILNRMNNFVSAVYSSPSEATNVSGSNVKQLLQGPKCLALGSSTTSFYPIRGLAPCSGITQSNAFNNTNSAKRGLRFKVPFVTRLVGVRWNPLNVLGDHNWGVYSDAGSELSSSVTAFEGDIGSATTGGVRYLPFDNPVELAKDTWYRVALEPTSASNVNLSFIQVPNANYMSAMFGGLNQHYTTFASGSWVDTATDTLPVMELLFDKFDDGVGGGGGVTRRIIS